LTNVRCDSFRMGEVDMMGTFYVDDAEILAGRPLNVEIFAKHFFGEVLEVVGSSDDE
jgi:hypothetical protein